MRIEPRIDGVVEWSRSIEGYLEFETEVTKFGDWIISHSDIDDAVLNTEKIWWRASQSLAISSGPEKYLFALAEPVTDDYKFPFHVTYTKSGTYLGKLFNLIFLLSGIYLAFVIWSLLVNFVLAEM